MDAQARPHAARAREDDDARVGRGERGSKTIRLTPGQYLPKADPYFCETERGQGFDKPEIGGQFVVPDYCAWTVSSVRGLVQHQHGTAVKAARPGSSVAPGDAIVTPARRHRPCCGP